MKLSARNLLKGKITSIKIDGIFAQVKIDIGGQNLNSTITKEAIEDLGLKIGDEAFAVIKSSSVMIGLSHTHKGKEC